MAGLQRPKWHAAVAGRSPAPGGLELVRAFINSADIEAGTDALSTATSAQRWLRDHDVAVGRRGITNAERDRLVEVREALRDLLAARETGDTTEAARATLDRAAVATPLRAGFASPNAVTLTPAGHGADALVGRILAEVASASIAGTWDRLKVCRNDACRWAFYDASKNHSGTWCSMAVCGNRSKGRAFRGRHRPAEVR